MESTLIDEYKSKDLGECAALLCKSARLLHVDPQGSVSYFVFSGKSYCEEVSNEYWFGQLLINAKTYNDALRTLKDRLFARK